MLELSSKPVSEKAIFLPNANVAYESAVLIPRPLFELRTLVCVCGVVGTAEGGIRLWLCLCGSKSLTELADPRADGEKWVHPLDKHTQIPSPTHTNRHTHTHTHTHTHLCLPLSFFLSHVHTHTHTHTHTHIFWLNNGPVSGVPMGKAVSLIESCILHSPCLLIDSVRLFCLTKRLTFPPAWLWLSQWEWLYVCVCPCTLFTWSYRTCVFVCVCVCLCVCILRTLYSQKGTFGQIVC